MELPLLEHSKKADVTGRRHINSRWVVTALPPLILSGCASAVCFWQTNLTLGLFLGPLILTTLYAPCLILADHRRARLSVLAGMIGGPAIVWLLVSATSQAITSRQILFSALVLAGWVAALCGGSLFLRALGLVPSLAYTLTVIVSFIWLAWPVWLSALLVSHERTISWLCWAHPVIAMNSAVRHLGLWGSPMGGSDLAYRYLTVLNQDVAYPHSESIWPCVLLHCLVGILLGSFSMMLGNVRLIRSQPLNA